MSARIPSIAFTGSPSKRRLSFPELIHLSMACSAARVKAPLPNPNRLIAASRKRLSRSLLSCSLNPAKRFPRWQMYIRAYSHFCMESFLSLDRVTRKGNMASSVAPTPSRIPSRHTNTRHLHDCGIRRNQTKDETEKPLKLDRHYQP